jgi:hypothetical protein
VKISDVLAHRPRFVDTNGEFQIELKLSGIETYFERDFFFASTSQSPAFARAKTTPAEDDAAEQVSSEFSFGPFAWAVAVKPTMRLSWNQVSIRRHIQY